eukprot:scaffold2393_cov267-Pinguiococcus_pyrenoidosus.AAC.15
MHTTVRIHRQEKRHVHVDADPVGGFAVPDDRPLALQHFVDGVLEDVAEVEVPVDRRHVVQRERLDGVWHDDEATVRFVHLDARLHPVRTGGVVGENVQQIQHDAVIGVRELTQAVLRRYEVKARLRDPIDPPLDCRLHHVWFPERVDHVPTVLLHVSDGHHCAAGEPKRVRDPADAAQPLLPELGVDKVPHTTCGQQNPLHPVQEGCGAPLKPKLHLWKHRLKSLHAGDAGHSDPPWSRLCAVHATR